MYCCFLFAVYFLAIFRAWSISSRGILTFYSNITLLLSLPCSEKYCWSSQIFSGRMIYLSLSVNHMGWLDTSGWSHKITLVWVVYLLKPQFCKFGDLRHKHKIIWSSYYLSFCIWRCVVSRELYSHILMIWFHIKNMTYNPQSFDNSVNLRAQIHYRYLWLQLTPYLRNQRVILEQIGSIRSDLIQDPFCLHSLLPLTDHAKGSNSNQGKIF